MRGGVPELKRIERFSSVLSPHAWGCTDYEKIFASKVFIVPTCVGVYRTVSI